MIPIIVTERAPHHQAKGTVYIEYSVDEWGMQSDNSNQQHQLSNLDVHDP